MLLPLPQNARSALVVVDMQEFFSRKPERRRNLETVVANINQMIEHFESRQLPVFHVVTSYKADGSDWELDMLDMRAKDEPELIKGTPETAILPQIKVADNHTVLAKTRYSAFFRTDLADLLRAENVHRVVVGRLPGRKLVNSCCKIVFRRSQPQSRGRVKRKNRVQERAQRACAKSGCFSRNSPPGLGL